MKEPGLIKYEQTIEGDRATVIKEYDTSMSNLVFGLIAVSLVCLTSAAIAKMILATPSVVIQQPQQPARVVSY